MIDALLAFDLY